MSWIIAFNIASSIVIILYIVIARTGIYAETSQYLRVSSNRCESSEIDISKPNTFTWEILKQDWQYEGDAKLSIVFPRINDLPAEKYQPDTLSLRMKITAYALTQGASKYDRIIRDWYYNTDDPLANKSTLWSTWGSAMVEYGLAGISRRFNEDLFIEATIVTPDVALAQTKPRLRIVGDHASSKMAKIALVRMLDIAGLIIAIVLLILINVLCAIGNH